MSYQVLARKWRPRGFPELVGQDHVRRALANALDSGRLHHAYLFTGTRGVGKTTIARILAKSLNCEANGVSSEPCGECSACREIDEGRFVDLIEVDAASRTRVEETRELLENVPYAPTRGRYKVYLIDEVHMFSQHSFNALLKTLEEPPPHVRFLLATTDPQKVPVTILSRCLQFNLKLMPVPTIVGQLQRILDAEGVAYDEPALGQIARAASGSMRDALSLLDQAIAFGDGAVRAEDVEGMLGTLSRDRLFALIEAVAGQDASALVTELDRLAEAAADFEPVLGDLLSLLHQLALAQAAPGAVDESVADAERVRELAGRLEPADVQLYYQIATLGRRDLNWAPDPRAGLEMTLLRMIAFRPDPDLGSSAPARTEPSRKAAAPSAPPPTTANVATPPKDEAAPAESPASPRASGGDAVAEPRVTGEPEPTGGAEHGVATNPEPESVPAASVAYGPELDWAATVSALGLRGLAGELGANTALLGVEDDRLRLALAPEHAHLGGERYRQRLEQALGEHFERKLRVELVHEQAPPNVETPADADRRRAEARRAEAQESIESDPVVQAFQSRFGAEIQTDSIRPVESGGNDEPETD